MEHHRAQGRASAGHRRRLRERFLKSGADSLHEHELLELLLSVAVPRIDTKPAAWTLLKEFGTVPAVLDASPAQLQSVLGIGPAAACALKIVKAAATAYLKGHLAGLDLMDSPAAVADYCRAAFGSEPNESLHVLLMDNRNRVKRVVRLSDGSVDQSTAYPRRVLEASLEARASAVILVHNHPSGALDPSAEDERFTHDVLRALRTVGIRLVDHLIVSREGALSFRERGRLGV